MREELRVNCSGSRTISSVKVQQPRVCTCGSEELLAASIEGVHKYQPARKAAPFRLPPPCTRHIHVARPSGSSAANIGNPADVSPQAEEGFQRAGSAFFLTSQVEVDFTFSLLWPPSPAKRGKVPTAGAGAPANSGAGPKGERHDGASQADGGALSGYLSEPNNRAPVSLSAFSSRARTARGCALRGRSRACRLSRAAVFRCLR